jgi:hypothetical protein
MKAERQLALLGLLLISSKQCMMIRGNDGFHENKDE